MGWLAKRKRRREIHRELDRLWKPTYDALAHYNSRKADGVEHDPEMDAAMARIQREYNEVYRPRAQALREELHR